MANYWRSFLDYYNDFHSDADPRTKDWLFISSPVLPAIFTLAYAAFLLYGPRWMEKRQAFKLKEVLVVYNFGMVIFSAYIVKEFLVNGWLYDYSFACEMPDYSNDPKALGMAGAVWMFYIAKYIELLDTVFFILRKKNNQVTFLHVFHHGGLPVFWWWGIKDVPGGVGTFHAMVNAIIHVVMYFYYGLSAMGPKFRKYLWWKRYVTILQLSQFLLVTIHSSVYLYSYLYLGCPYPWKYMAFIQGFTTIVAILFLNFYINTYGRSARQIKHTEKTNNHVANGVSNGHVANGAISNGTVHNSDSLKRRNIHS